MPAREPNPSRRGSDREDWGDREYYDRNQPVVSVTVFADGRREVHGLGQGITSSAEYALSPKALDGFLSAIMNVLPTAADRITFVAMLAEKAMPPELDTKGRPITRDATAQQSAEWVRDALRALAAATDRPDVVMQLEKAHALAPSRGTRRVRV